MKKLQHIQEAMEQEKKKIMEKGCDLLHTFESLNDIKNYFTKNLGLDSIYEKYAYVVKALLISARQRAFDQKNHVHFLPVRSTFFATISYHLSWFHGCIDKTYLIRVDRPQWFL